MRVPGRTEVQQMSGTQKSSLCFRQRVRQKTAVTTDTAKEEIGCAAEEQKEKEQ